MNGRNCRLADGTSRNPVDRNELLAQRTKDLEGLAGQVRNFDLDKYLSDREEIGIAQPWGLGDSVLPPSDKATKAKATPALASSSGLGIAAARIGNTICRLPLLMSIAGILPILTVLYVCARLHSCSGSYYGDDKITVSSYLSVSAVSSQFICSRRPI